MKKKTWISMLLLIAMFVSTACGSTEAPTAAEEPTTAPTAAVEKLPISWDESNKRVIDAAPNVKHDYCSYRGNMYYFHAGDAELSEREEFVYAADAFLQAAGEYAALKPLTIIVTSTENTMSRDGEAIIAAEEMFSGRAMTTLLLALTGESCNYGLAYGFTQALCAANGIECFDFGRMEDSKLAKLYNDAANQYVLDLTMPEFEGYFLSEDVNNAAKATALSFTEFYLAQEGSSLETLLALAFSGESTEELKNAWLGTIGSTGSYTAQYDIVYVHNYNSERGDYPYVVYMPMMNWFFSITDLQDEGYAAYLDQFLVMCGYMENDFSEAQEVLSEFIIDEVQSVDIYTDFITEDATAETASAVYSQATKRITLYHDWDNAKYSLLHEYVHYLTISNTRFGNVTVLLFEGVAEEVSALECENKMSTEFYRSFIGDEYKDRYLERGLWDTEDDALDVHKYLLWESALYYVGATAGDSYLSITYAVVERTPDMSNTITMNQLSYPEAMSLTRYLLETYGRDTVFMEMKSIDDILSITGMTWRELYDAWGAWVLEECAAQGIVVM